MERRRIRLAIGLFMVGLVLSGLTAFPLVTGVEVLHGLLPPDGGELSAWIGHVHQGVQAASRDHGFLFYGTDWLAFAHLVIAVAFVGPLRDPQRNIWVLEFGMIACALVIPLALICGPIRGIPFFWRLIDCSFGVLGFVPLAYAWTLTRRLS